LSASALNRPEPQQFLETPLSEDVVNKGVLYAFLAYGMWGFFPIYFKLLLPVTAMQILAHRVIWSVAFLVMVLLLMRQWPRMRAALTWKIVLIYLFAACLLAVNWFAYIWGVNSGFIVEASLGYFINPLVNVLLGVVFLRERLKIWQWIPIGMAACGVLYLTFSYGNLPWIALTLAFTFGLYGLMKKIAPLSALHGLTLETLLLFVPAMGYLLWMESQGTGYFGHVAPATNGLLAFGGVLTALPLLLFAGAAHRIPLSTMGLIQYVAPTLQFLIGVLVYHEPFTEARVVGFVIIWLALILYSGSSLVQHRRAMLTPAHLEWEQDFVFEKNAHSTLDRFSGGSREEKQCTQLKILSTVSG
jgi:chloramphenicol-sensitive protein RarD